MWKLLVFSLFFITACANNLNDKDELYSAFVKYDKNIISKSNLNEFFTENSFNDKDLDDPSMFSQFTFKTYMTYQVEHFTRIDGTQGCLTINGLDQDKLPVSFNIEYLNVNHKWLISAVGILFVDNPEEFSKLARCPYEYVD